MYYAYMVSSCIIMGCFYAEDLAGLADVDFQVHAEFAVRGYDLGW